MSSMAAGKSVCLFEAVLYTIYHPRDLFLLNALGLYEHLQTAGIQESLHLLPLDHTVSHNLVIFFSASEVVVHI